MLLGLLLALTAPDGAGEGAGAGNSAVPEAPVPAVPAAMSAVGGPGGSAGAGPVLAGGYAPLSPRAPELRPVLAAAMIGLTPARPARARIARARIAQARIVRAERQVVAGLNYRLLVKLRDGSRWRVVVWQRLDGGYEVTDVAREG